MKKIILASASPRRAEILTKLNLPFEIVPSTYEEDMSLEMAPSELAIFLSKHKALEVAQRQPDALIIGADTFVSLDGELLGKPHTPQAAKKMLEKISGKTLETISGITIIDSRTERTISKAVVSKISHREITASEIDAFVKTKNPLDKAGAMEIQGIGAIFIEKIEGDYFNIMGLSLFETAKLLQEFGVELF